MATSTINKETIRQTVVYPSAVTVTAGTIGTFATSANVNIAKTGYKVVGCEISITSHPSNALTLLTGYDNSKATLCFYRTNTVQVTVPARDIELRVTYQKA